MQEHAATHHGAITGEVTAGRKEGGATAASQPPLSRSGSLTEAVGVVEQAFAAAKVALVTEDIGSLAPALATGRRGLSQIRVLSDRANLAPDKAQAIRADVAALERYCSQAEATLRMTQDVSIEQLQAVAQRVDTAIAALKANTAGSP